MQVHPSPEYAREHDDAYLKSEAWYVIHAEPGAKIYKGIREGTTPEQLRDAIKENTDEAVVPLLMDIPVKAGDCHYLPSGTCHALGEGILVAEVQTPSDTTFRVYDWGREGRELHVEQALKCIDFGPADTARYEPDAKVTGLVAETTKRVVCDYFRISEVYAHESYDEPLPMHGGDGPMVWMVLDGGGTVSGGGETMDLRKGQTIYLPPGLRDGRASVEGGGAVAGGDVSPGGRHYDCLNTSTLTATTAPAPNHSRRRPLPRPADTAAGRAIGCADLARTPRPAA